MSFTTHHPTSQLEYSRNRVLERKRRQNRTRKPNSLRPAATHDAFADSPQVTKRTTPQSRYCPPANITATNPSSPIHFGKEAVTRSELHSFIPFNCISRVGTEARYIEQAFAALHISGDGMFTRKCHEILEQSLGVRKALLTTSCTHALELSALLLDIKPGDEVIVPSFTFPSVANAFVLQGARPVFADIRPDTLNLDESRLPEKITRATRAIIPVHYAGVGCEMDAISSLADRHGISIVEDNAHGLFGQYRGRALGTFGRLATLSFHETKNFSSGEGGALLVNDPLLIDRAEIIREKGTNRKQFYRGQVDKYTWIEKGSSFLPSDILAAVLFAQLEVRETIQQRRQRVWETYHRELAPWAAAHDVKLPYVPAHCEQSFHIFYMVMPSLAARTALIEHLASRQILSVFHYMPLHLSQMGRYFGGYPGECPVAEYVSDRLLRLPLYSALSEADQARVIDAIRTSPFPPVHRSAKNGTAHAPKIPLPA